MFQFQIFYYGYNNQQDDLMINQITIKDNTQNSLKIKK
jgi:hypothetical protein